MLLSLAACAGDAGPALVADGLESMQTMLVLVEQGATVRGYAHPFAGADRGLTVDTAGADRVTVLFYAEPVDRLGIAHGPITFVSAGRALPTPMRAFSMEVGSEAWRSVEALGDRLRGLLLPPLVEDLSGCVAPTLDDFALTSSIPAREEVVTFLVAERPGRVLAGTNRGSLFVVTATSVTQLTTLDRVGTGAGWLQPGTSKLWTSRDRSLVTIDLETRAVTTQIDGLVGFVNLIAGTSGAGQPADLLLATQSGEVLSYVEGAPAATMLGTIPESAARTGDAHIEPYALGRGWLTLGGSQVADLDGTRPGLTLVEPFADDDCSDGTPKRITHATAWEGRPALVRRCLRTRTNPTTMREESTDIELLVRSEGADWQLLPDASFARANMQSSVPMLGGLLLAGANTNFVRVLASGTFCPVRLASAGPGKEYHFVHAAALDARTVVLSGPPKDGSDMTAPAHVVVLGYPER